MEPIVKRCENNKNRKYFRGDAAFAKPEIYEYLVLPSEIKHWSLRSLLVKLIKIGAKVVWHSRYITFQMTEVAIDERLFAKILARIEQLCCYSV